MALGNNLKKEKLIPNGINENQNETLTENTTTMETQLQTAEQVKPKSNGNGVTNEQVQEMRGKLDAIGKSQAVIEFNLDGTIITANDNFLNAMGYKLGEVQGKHHRIFVEESYGRSTVYAEFWAKLNRGEFMTDEFKRIGKGGKEIWIQASYNPIFDSTGRPYKVVKFATDVTEQKIKNADYEGQLEAIGKSNAVIEFNMDGTIITANDNFLSALGGYSLNDVKGKHHRMFVDSSYAASQEYSEFWRSFKDGKAKTGEFLRKAKGGSTVWLSANYTPVINAQGVAVKVIKLARDISKEKQLLEQSHQQAEELKAQEEELKQNMEELSAIQEDMQRKEIEMSAQFKAIDNSQAFIEFDLDGKIINANDMFLQTMKYSLNEVKGKHHRMFVDKDYAESSEYRDFWKTFSEGKSKSGEFLRKAKDGSSVWLSANYTPVVDPQGRVLKVIKLARNISEAKLLQQQSQKQVEVMKAQEERMAQKEKEYLKRIKELEREPASSIAK